MKNEIKWYKVKCSLYEQAFGIRNWLNILDFMNIHIGFDIEIRAQTTDRFEGVDIYFENKLFHKTK